MSWYVSRTSTCENCGYFLDEDVSTLTMGRKNFNKCPKCGGDLQTKNNQQNINEFLKKLIK